MIGRRIAKQLGEARKEQWFFVLLRRVRWKIITFPLIFIGLVLGVTLSEEVRVQPKNAVSVFDVGQGDAVLVKSKEGVTVLIDGGPTSNIVEHLDSALPYRDREIDYLITTHPHADHLTGLVSVLERFPVKNVIMTGVVHTTDVYLEFLDLVKEKKCSPVISTEPRAERSEAEGEAEKFQPDSSSKLDDPPRVEERQRVEAGISRLASLARDDNGKSCVNIIVANRKRVIEDQDVAIEILWPQESFEGKSVTDRGEDTEGGLNDTSVVSRITLDGVTFLFPGDAGSGVEKKILEANEDVKSDVLILAHHGSKTASSEEWLRAINPKYAAISAGAKNKYGLPAYLIVRRVERLGIPIFRTDQDGTIEFFVDNGTVSVKTER